jgi:hypothetical protein
VISLRRRAMAAGVGRSWPRHSATSISNMSGGSCVLTRLTSRGANPGASNDPEFAAKAADIVGLYLAPPENAIGAIRAAPGLVEGGATTCPVRLP